MSRRPYSYSVLRYVHDIVTGEFVNVGIVFAAPPVDGESPIVLCEFKNRIQRLRELFPDIDRMAFTDSIDAIRRASKMVIKDQRSRGMFSEGDARTIATKMLPHDGSSLQWSEVGTGLAKDIHKEFERISFRMLSSYDKKSNTKRSDEDVWRPVRQAIAERDIGIEFEKKTIKGEVDTIEFKHSWKNGIVHAYEPLSFDLSDGERIKDKARKWMGHLSAVGIGAHDQFQAHFIVGRPSNTRLLKSYEGALEILKSAPNSPEIYEEGQISELVDKIEDGYRHHIEQSGAGRS